MKTFTQLSLLTSLISLVSMQQVAGQTTSQINQNATRRWYDASTWLVNASPSGVGASALVNQDFNSFRHVADMTETVATVAGSPVFPQTTTKVLTAIPINGTLAVSDTGFGHSWSQARGSTNQAAFNVTYNQGTNTVTIVATPPANSSLPASVRTIDIAYATASNTPFSDQLALLQRVGQTNGSTLTFTATLAQNPVLTAMGVSDGTNYWTPGAGPTGSFTVAFNASTRVITVTYPNVAAAPSGRNIMLCYVALGSPGLTTVATGTFTSGAAITVTRSLTAAPTQDANFRIVDGATAHVWTNGTSTTPANYTVAYTAPTTVVVTYKNSASFGAIGASRTLTAAYLPLVASAKDVTLGSLFLGDVSGGDGRIDLRLNKLIFDNAGQVSQLNNIQGAPNEIAGNIVLNNRLVADVRTGGDSVGTNSNSFLISANMSGIGALEKIDSGNWTLAGSNTYTGETLIRSTGGTTYLENTLGGNAIGSSNFVIGNTSKDGNTTSVVQLGASNQIADTTKLFFDAASGRNSYLKTFGFNDTIGGIRDVSREGVIENTESETPVGGGTNSVLTINANDNTSFYNGYIRNKAGGAASSTLGITKSGTGTVTLQGDRLSYSGPTTIDAGTLRLENITNPLGNLPVNPLTLSDVSTSVGGFNANNSPRFRSDVTVSTGANLELFARGAVRLGSATSQIAGVNWTFGNVISGAGGLTKSGGSNVTLTNVSTYTGETSVTNGSLVLSTGVRKFTENSLTDQVLLEDRNFLTPSNRLVAEIGHGSILQTSAIKLNGGNLVIQNAQPRTTLIAGTSTPQVTPYNSPDRVKNDAVIISESGGINMAHTDFANFVTAAGAVSTPAAINYSEVVGNLKLQRGLTTVSQSQALPGSTSTLTLTKMERTGGTAVVFSGPDIGVNAQNRVTIGDRSGVQLINGIIGGWAQVYDPPDPAIGATSLSSLSFATYDSTNGNVTRLATRTTQTGTLTISTANATLNQAKNYLVNNGNALFALSSATNTAVINTLQIEDNANRTVTVDRGILKLGAGGLLVGTRDSVNRTFTLSSTNNGRLTSGLLSGVTPNVRDFVIGVEGDPTNNSLTPGSILALNAEITDDGANRVTVIKTGAGTLDISGTQDFTGGLKVLQGIVEVQNASSLGRNRGAGSGYVPGLPFLTLDGGRLQFANRPAGTTTATNEFVTNEKNTYLGPKGGEVFMPDGVVLKWNGLITGPGGLFVSTRGGTTVNGGGVLELQGTHDFQGFLNVDAGNVVLMPHAPVDSNDTYQQGHFSFKGGIYLDNGTVTIKPDVVFDTKPDLSLNGGTLFLHGDFTAGSFLNRADNGGVLSAVISNVGATGTAPTNFIVQQDLNGGFAGVLRDGTEFNINNPMLNFTKRGQGQLNLSPANTTEGAGSRYTGVVSIEQGALAVNRIDPRGTYGVALGTGQGVNPFAPTAQFLKIADGAALILANASSTVTSDFTNRPFTLGSGTKGVSILNNSGPVGDYIHWQQGTYDADASDTVTSLQDNLIAFETANQSTLLNLGGSNAGVNTFGMTLRDNGTAPLSLTKTGTGRWMLGQADFLVQPNGPTSPNTHSGRTTIYSGTLGVLQSGVFGAAGGESVNLLGGNLDLMGVDYTVNERLSLAGGRLRTTNGNNAWTGSVSVDASTVLEMQGNSNLLIRGPLEGKGALTKQGLGTLTMQGANTYAGGLSAQEGTLRLDYTSNPGSKLADGSGLSLGGGRQGATLDVVGGTNVASPIIEIVANLSLGLGQNRITRSDATSTTKVRINEMNNLRISQGTALDVQANNIVQTDRLNATVGGILGAWMTVAGSDWAVNATNAADGEVVGLTTYGSNAWATGTNTLVTADTTQTDVTTNTLKFGNALSTTTTLVGTNAISTNGILVAPSVGTNSNLIKGGTLAVQMNPFGSDLTVHQSNKQGVLTIASTVSNPVALGPVVGQFYVDNLGTRFQAGDATMNNAQRAALVKDWVPGMNVRGDQLVTGCVVTAIDYATGKVDLHWGRYDQNVAITVGATTFADGQTMLGGVLNRVRVRGTSPQLLAIANGQTISGGRISATATVTAIAYDFPSSPTEAYLTISLAMTVPSASPIAFTLIPTMQIEGQFYLDGVTNRFRPGNFAMSAGQRGQMLINVSSGVAVAGVSASGATLEADSVITGIDYNNGNTSISFGLAKEENVTVTIGSTVFTVTKIMAFGTQNRVDVKRNPSVSQVTGIGQLRGIGVGQAISGGSIPASTVVTGVTLDDPDAPTLATVTMNQNVTVPAPPIGFLLTLTPRGGVSKFGEGTLALTGDNTYNGITYITQGRLAVDRMGNFGQASPLGMGPALSGIPLINAGAASLQINAGGILGYSGDSTVTDRGFTVNNRGTVEVSNGGSTLDIRGNISGGTGLGAGVLEKTGAGTLRITRTGGQVATATDPATIGIGGSTSLGGIDVRDGRLQFAYDNPNSNENANRFASTASGLRVAGGAFELVGMKSTILVQDPTKTQVGDPNENRSQTLAGQLTIGMGASEIRVTGATGTETTLVLQDSQDLNPILREPGGTLTFVENGNGGIANIRLPASVEQSNSGLNGGVLPWATYKDVGQIDRPGINDFATFTATNNGTDPYGVFNADVSRTYAVGGNVRTMVPFKINSESGVVAFTGTITPGGTATTAQIGGLRFFSSANTAYQDEPGTPGEVRVAAGKRLELTAGAILVGYNVGAISKSINGGELTSLFESGITTVPLPGTVAPTDNIRFNKQYDLIVHQQNPVGRFEIGSNIVDTKGRGFREPLDSAAVLEYAQPVNLVHTGVGTTILSGTNTYTGSTFLTGGTLRLSSASALPGGIATTGGSSNLLLKGGVLGLEGDFSRALGTTPDAVQWQGSGGFAAYGADRTANIGGAGAQLIWEAPNFVPGGNALLLSSKDATHTITLANPIDLGATHREFNVRDSSATVDAVISGAVTGAGGILRKTGYGSLLLGSSSNTYSGGTELAQGTLVATGGGLGSSQVRIGTTDSTDIADRLTLQLTGGTLPGSFQVGNRNSGSITEFVVSTSTTVSGGIDLGRRVIIATDPGRALTIAGTVQGANGGFVVSDGGALVLQGANTIGTGNVAGSAIDGGITVRGGSVRVGHAGGLGGSVVELGDTFTEGSAKANVTIASKVIKLTTTPSMTPLVGMEVIGNGIPAGTLIASISGVDLTLTAAATSTNAATPISFGLAVVRSSAGRSVLVQGGVFYNDSNGRFGVSGGKGAFLFTSAASNVSFPDPTSTLPSPPTVISKSLVIDGTVYSRRDLMLAAKNGTPAPRFLINGETDDPTSNGIYELYYVFGFSIDDPAKPDTISLRRVTELDDADELVYGTRVKVLGGTDAGKTFYLASPTPTNLPARDQFDRIPITTSLLWLEDKQIVPNVSLLADVGNLTIGNAVDINNLGASGTANLGGSGAFTSGSSIFTGPVVLRAGQQNVNLLSETNTGLGVVFAGEFTQSAGAQLSFTKQGSGTVTLSAANTFTGGLQVNAGTLLANNVAGSATGTGAVTVANFGSVLGGSGKVDGFTSVLGGGAISPGDPTINGGVGTLKLAGGLTLGLDSRVNFQIAGDVAFDVLDVDGLLTVDPSAVFRVILDAPPSALASFKLLDWTTRSWAGSLSDRLELDALTGVGLYWNTSLFDSTGTISVGQRDINTPPTARFAAREVTVNEAGAPVIRVAIELDWATSSGVSIPLSFGTGTARQGSTPADDFEVSPNPVIFNAGERSKIVTITVRDDTLAEDFVNGFSLPPFDARETAVVSMDTPTNATKGLPSSFTVNIVDNDAGVTASDTFTLRNPKPSNETIRSFATNGTRHIAVGSMGTLLASTDAGLTWSAIDQPAKQNLNAVAHNGTHFLAVGDRGRVLFSTDGATWSIRSVGASTDLNDVIWTGTHFVAVGSGGSVFTSTSQGGDDLAWTALFSGQSAILHAIAGTSSLLVAVGDGGVVVTSTDSGSTWAASTSGVSANLKGIAHNGSLFVAVGDSGTAISSADAVAWTAQTSGTTGHLTNVDYDGSAFIAVGLAGDIRTSPTGTAWTAQTGASTGDLRAVAKLGSTIFTGGSAGLIQSSATGATWARASTGSEATFNGVVSTTAKLIAVGSAGAVSSSSDNGATWSTQTVTAANTYNSVAGTTARLIAVGQGGVGIQSTDGGSAWTAVNTGVTGNLNGIAQLGTRFVAVGDDAVIRTTTDGTTWTTSLTPVGVTGHLRAIASSTTLLVAVGDNGRIITSTTGTDLSLGSTGWNTAVTDVTSTLRAVTFTGTQWVAVGDGGTVLTSTTGASWTKRASTQSGNLLAVATVGTMSQVIAVGSNGAAVFSRDHGVTWKRRTTNTSADLKAIVNRAFTDVSVLNRYAIVGTSGTILTTDNNRAPAPTLFLSAASATMTEGTGPYALVVNLSPAPPAGAKVTVPYTITQPAAPNGATRAVDYDVAYNASVTATSITFVGGESTKVINITPKGDALTTPVEQNLESFTLTLGAHTATGISAASIVKVAPFIFTGTIENDYRLPVVTASPPHAIILAGSSHTLSADGNGSGELKYQWLKPVAPVPNSLPTAASLITGATTKVLSFTNIAVASAGKYVWKVYNPAKLAGTLTTGAELAVVERLASKLQLELPNSNVILTTNAGGTAYTTLGKTGIKYQWQFQRDGTSGFVDIATTDLGYAGAQTKSLTIKVLTNGTPAVNSTVPTPNDEGIYRCNVSLVINDVVFGNLTGTETNVLVAEMPQFTVTPLPTTGAPLILPAAKVGTLYNFGAPGAPLPGGHGLKLEMVADTDRTPTSYVVTGLPLGMTWDKTTGVIYGTPTDAIVAPKTYAAISITATNKRGSTVLKPCSITVHPFDQNAVGTYTGLYARAGTHYIATPAPAVLGTGTLGLGALLSVTTTTSGSYTATLRVGPNAHPAVKGFLNTATANPTGSFTINRSPTASPITVNFTLDISRPTLADPPADRMTGTIVDPTLGSPIAMTHGWRNTKRGVQLTPTATTFVRVGKTFNFAAFLPSNLRGDVDNPRIPQGDSYATADVTALTGLVSIAGKAADGSVITSTGSSLSPTGEFIIYTGLYTAANPGAFSGVGVINAINNEVTGTATWNRTAQPIATKLYQAGFDRINLTLTGGLYVKPATGEYLIGTLDALGPNNVKVTYVKATFFHESGLELNLNPDPTGIPQWNIPSPNLNAAMISDAHYWLGPPTTSANPNPASVYVTALDATKGSFIGNFSLIDTNYKVLPRNRVPFQGLIIPDAAVPGAEDGVGFFILPGATTTEATKSGRVSIEARSTLPE